MLCRMLFVRFLVTAFLVPPALAQCAEYQLSSQQPLRIQASEYCNSHGLVIEYNGDESNVGFLDPGDFMSFNLQIMETGSYRISYRVASLDGHGGFELSTSQQGQVFRVTSMPETDGWQNWYTVDGAAVDLVAGTTQIKVLVEAAGWNLQWLQFELATDAFPCPAFSKESTSNLIEIPASQYCSHQGTVKETVNGLENVGYLDPGDWMSWNILVDDDGSYYLRVTLASPNGSGGFDLSTNQGHLVSLHALPSTGGWHNWQTVEFEITLSSSDTRLAMEIASWGWNLLSIELEPLITYEETGTPTHSPSSAPSQTPSESPSLAPTTLPSAPPSEHPSPSPSTSPTTSPTIAPSRSPIDQSAEIPSRSMLPSGAPSVPPTAVPTTDSPTTSPTQTPVATTGCYQNFISPGQEPVHIDASDFCGQQGVVVETNNGIENVGFLDQGDWLSYMINVQQADTYTVRFRIASLDGDGSFSLSVGNLVVLQVDDIPATNGWYSWTTTTHSVELPADASTLTLTVLEPGWNIQWIEFEEYVAGEPCTLHSESSSNGIIRIPAHNFCTHFGTTTETNNGVENVGFLDDGDWLSWDLLVEDGPYIVRIRAASPEGNGGFDLSTNQRVLWSQNGLPASGGWHEWETIEFEVTLSSSDAQLILEVTSWGWNLLWIELELIAETGPQDAPTAPPVTGTPNENFVRAIDKDIVGPDGQSLLLKGMGLGGWMLQEPYMMMSDDAQGQWQMFQRVSDLIGPDNFETYRTSWLDSWFTQDDVKALKHGGFNSIRVPLHYNLFTLPIEDEPIRGQDTWLDDGFNRLDDVLTWCETEGMYAILDLHAAPGGQGLDSKICDYDSSKPSMWEDDENVRKAVALWGKLAERYVDRTIIAGYDLLNEPNWRFDNYPWLNPHGCDEVDNGPLRDFNDRAIAAIREVDNDHLIFVEGNCWGNNHNGLWPIDDHNVALSFHRYWIDNNYESIQTYLEMRDFHNIPLWVGESGENHDTWYREAVELLERHDIGWAWWSHKKMQSTSGAYAIYPPSGYQQLLDYWYNGGARPDADFAFEVMQGVAQAALLQNVYRNHGAIEALTGKSMSCDDAPVTTVQGRARLQAESFCGFGGAAIESTQDEGSGRNVYWMDSNGWISHRIEVPVAGTYNVHFRVASLDGHGSLDLIIGDNNGSVIGVIDSIPETDSWQAWTTVSMSEVQLPSGVYTISIKSTSSGWNLNWFELTSTL